MVLRTPSGLSLADAEKHTRRQKTQLDKNRASLKEGQFFRGDEGLIQSRGGEFFNIGLVSPTLDPNMTEAQKRQNPDYVLWMNAGRPDIAQQSLDAAVWQGQTQAQLLNQQTAASISSLGINQSNIIDLRDDKNFLFRDLFEGKNITSQTLDEFRSGLLSPGNTSALGGLPDLTPPTSGFTGSGDVSSSGASILPNGNLKLANGQIISSQDPNFQTFLAQEGLGGGGTVQTAAGGQQNPTNNPFFGIPAGAAKTVEEARILQAGGVLPNPNDASMLSSLADRSGLGRKISNVEELNRLAAEGLTEDDIIRRGGDIYLKPDSGVGDTTGTTGGGTSPGAGTGATGAIGAGIGTPGVAIGGTTGVGTGGGTTPGIADGATQDPFLKAMQDLLEFQKGRPSVLDQFKQFRSELGLGEKEERLSGIQEQVLKTEGLLDKLEGDINERIQGFGLNEAQRRRALATEGKPLREQLGDLAQQEKVSLTGVNAARQQLSDLMNLHSQQEDNLLEQQQTALNIAKFQSDQAREAGQSEKDIVEGYVKKYADAGIKLTDSLTTAQEKLKNSKIYQNDVRLLNKSGGGTGPGLSYKFSTSQRNGLIEAGFDSTTRNQMQSDIQLYGKDAVAQGLSGKELEDFKRIFKISTPEAPKSIRAVQDAALSKLKWTPTQIRAYNDYSESIRASVDPQEFKTNIRPDLFSESKKSSSGSQSREDFLKSLEPSGE